MCGQYSSVASLVVWLWFGNKKAMATEILSLLVIEALMSIHE